MNCTHFHLKIKARNMCNSCYKKWLKNTPVHLRESQNLVNHFCKNHPNKPVESLDLCATCYRKDLYVRNPKSEMRDRNTRRNGHLLRVFKISLDDYNELLAKQNLVCYICKRNNGGKCLAVDHCHKTGKIRGLLCIRCNLFLEKIEKDPSVLRRIAFYLGNNGVLNGT